MKSPSLRLQIVFFLAFVIASFCFFLALDSKVIGEKFISDGEYLHLRFDGKKESPAVIAISNTKEKINLSSLVIFEEPDVLATYSEYQQFMALQEKINTVMQSERVDLHFDDGGSRTWNVRNRSIKDLPFSFYLQILVGLFCVAIGTSIWAFRVNDIAAWAYLMMGVAVSLSCFSSAVYTTRELYFDGSWFRYLSMINHFGALGFGSGLVTLFWVYPQKLINKPIIIISLSSFLIFWLVDTFQVFEETSTGYHLWPLLYTLIAFLGAGVQWRKTKNKPVERAILKWLLFSIMATTLIFVSFNIIPAFFAATTLGPQALTLTGFALGFGMMALGLRRYRLFNLDRWWYQYWFWFLAGASVVLIDLAIVSFLGFKQSSAIALSLLFVSWLYFPARQWLLMRFRPEAKTDLTSVLPVVTEELFSENSKEGIHQAWGRILDYVFSPLEKKLEKAIEETQLIDNGESLIVSSLLGCESYLLSYPEQGRRLFSPQDIRLVETMFEVVNRAELGLLAREQGAVEERARIKRDLHDDLGARLLSLTHSMNLDGSRQQARKAVGELRYILSELEQESCQFSEALEIWQAECRERLADSSFDLEWAESALPKVNLTPRARHNLSRILRELTSNVIKHSKGDKVSVLVSADKNEGRIQFSDNGVGPSDTRQENSFGMEIIASRIKELQGAVDWSASEAGYSVLLRFSI